jgi:hypothetical protein
MRKLWIVSASLSVCLVTGAWAAEEKKTMPPGHPEVGAKPAMPAGHPDVAGAKPGMPAGHPEVGGAKGGMPAGHPPTGAAHPPMPSTQPYAKAVVKVHAAQSTKDGKPVGEAPVFVDFYGEGGQKLKIVQAKLDAKGEATAEGPGVLCQPVVRVNYAGVGYQVVGEVMDSARPTQDVTVPVYEASEEQPKWTVGMHHVLVRPGEGGLRVMEMMSVTNSSDRTWTGSAENGQEKHTLSLALTPGAVDVSAPHMPASSVHFHGGTVLSTQPLLPGRSEFQVEYSVLAKDGKAELVLTAPADIGIMYVFVNDDGSQVTATGLESMGVRPTGEGNKKAFKAMSLKAGQQAKLSFTGIKAAPEAPRKAAGAATALPQIIAGVGGGIVLIGGAAYLLVKSPRKSA